MVKHILQIFDRKFRTIHLHKLAYSFAEQTRLTQLRHLAPFRENLCQLRLQVLLLLLTKIIPSLYKMWFQLTIHPFLNQLKINVGITVTHFFIEETLACHLDIKRMTTSHTNNPFDLFGSKFQTRLSGRNSD